MTSTRALKLSVGAGLAGLMMLLAGLAWDARLHAADADLAAREGIFTLSNPGHLLVAIGLAWIAVGAVGAAVTVFRTGRLVALGAMTMSAVLAAATGVWATAGGDTHEHASTSATTAVHEHTTTTAAGATTPAMPAMEESPGGHQHQATPYDERVAAATPAQRAAAQRLIDETTATVAAWGDESAAVAAGYRANPDAKSKNVHYINPAFRRDGRALDTTKPEGLVYRYGDDGSKTLMGAIYSARPGEAVPFDAYPIAVFHSHDEAGCPAFHATPEGRCINSPRMLHVWVGDGVIDPFGDNAGRATGRRPNRPAPSGATGLPSRGAGSG